MLFPEEALFAHVLLDLAAETGAHPATPAEPLPCDRWIARSVLQKAIRRGEPELAQRALANVFEYDRRATWRHLTIIALEDIGVANVDILARVVAAQRDREWRLTVGGDWAVVAELVRQMAESAHCQGACDLFLRATNDPSLRPLRDKAVDTDMGELTAWLADSELPLVQRGIAALATGGGLMEGQEFHDPAAVLDTFAELSSFSHVSVTCRAAWKISRNPMALLLPLVWQASWNTEGCGVIVDDPMPAVQLTSDIPGYALDQFTRRGNAISRAFLAESPEMCSLLDAAQIRAGEHARTVGDLIFLLEGGLVRRRFVWSVGQDLRLPHRWLPATAKLGSYLRNSLALIEAKACQIANLRADYLSPPRRA